MRPVHTQPIMRAALPLALTLAAFGCGGRTDLDLTSSAVEKGSAQKTSSETGTATGTYTTLPASSVTVIATTTVTVTATGYPCDILASNYDRSCAVDSDCEPVFSGNVCSTGCACNSAISGAALTQYNADVGRTRVAWNASDVSCGCDQIGPCCREGICQLGSECSSPGDTLAACADVGGTCNFGDPASCELVGPPDSCAYADETCCIPFTTPK